MSKLWGGAHNSIDPDMIAFTSSSDVSQPALPEAVLIPYDVRTNLAHAKALRAAGVFSEKEYVDIVAALNTIKKNYESGDFVFDDAFEDIHSQIEHYLTNEVGEAGKKIHTARSRNDQVTTDMFLYIRDQIEEAIEEVKALISTIEKLSKEHKSTICPGYTHHQKATVSSFGDLISAYAVMFQRDIANLLHIKDLYNYLPLGAVTGYESMILVDKNIIKDELGFEAIHENSVDVISSRGEFESAYASAISLCMTHASMLAQTLLTMSSQAYGYITLDGSLTTGSSVMPHKKNPDALEVIKAKSVYIRSLSTALEGTLQAAFVGYNRDSQYTKLIVMQVSHEFSRVPGMLNKIISSMKVNDDVMREEAHKHHVTTTGFMELLVVEKKLAMRDAKRLIEKAVHFSESEDVISYDALQKAVGETGVELKITKDECKEWQLAEYQLSRRRRFGV